jgi:hypothetical protein
MKVRTLEVFSLKLGYGNYDREHQISLEEEEKKKPAVALTLN